MPISDYDPATALWSYYPHFTNTPQTEPEYVLRTNFQSVQSGMPFASNVKDPTYDSHWKGNPHMFYPKGTARFKYHAIQMMWYTSMWDGLVGFQHPDCVALLDETARTLQRWVNSEPRIRLARYVELRVILRRGLRNWAILHSWWKETKARILAHTLYRPGGSGFIEVARTTLVGKKRDTRE